MTVHIAAQRTDHGVPVAVSCRAFGVSDSGSSSTRPAGRSQFPDWADVPHPPTDDDGPVTVIHVIRFHPGQADTNMVEYQNHAANTAVPHGVRIDGWLGVEGPIVGDGRQWDQVRFNKFPSKAAFMAVVFDLERLEAQKNHRETAMADTYTMVLRADVNRLADSV